MTKQKPTIILYDPHDGYSDEVDVSTALEEMKKILKIELEDLDEGFSGEAEDYAVYVAYPLYTSKLVQCPHTDEGAYNLEIIPHPQNFKLADGKTNFCQLVKDLHEANIRLAAQQKRIEELEKQVEAGDMARNRSFAFTELCKQNKAEAGCRELERIIPAWWAEFDEVRKAISNNGGSDNG